MEFLLNNTLNLTVNEVNDEEIPWNIYLLTYELTRRVNMLASIGIILTGLLGNGIIMFVFSQKRFRTNSSNVYLLSLAIVDSIYLIVHFLEDTVRSYNQIYGASDNLSSFDKIMKFFNITNRFVIACKLVNYFRYCFRFVSAYTVVLISFQRLFLIYMPFKKYSKKFALKCVLIVLAISLVINIRIGFLFNIQVNDMNIPYCDVPEENSHEYFIITSAYIFIIMLIPIVVLIISNSIIIYETSKKVMSRSQISKKVKTSASAKYQRKRYETVVDIKIKKYYSNVARETSSKPKNSAYAAKKLKRVLILLSCSYVLFNLPYLIIWLIYFNHISFSGKLDAKSGTYIFSALQIAELFNVLSYSLKFYIFCITGSKFRKQLKYGIQ